MAESVCVGVRVRPFNAREEKLNAVVCIDMNGPTTSIRDENDKPTHFTFDESFWSHDGFDVSDTGYSVAKPGSNYADQKYVFETFGKRVLDNAWEGYHCCLFAYGQTGAGKSYSMVGYGANKGIVPISCEEVFRRIESNDQPDKRYEVTVSMIEIYNEAVQDLLIMPEDRPKKGLEIRESKLLGIYIDGVLKRPVRDYPEIEACIDEATSHRTVGSTLMNATSSRAHTVQIIEFKQVVTVAGKEQVKISMINLVDLAGSEKAGQTGASGDRLKEGAAINKSLSALGNVIEKLAEKSGGKGKNVIIPYRDSKLTRLLQNALGGSSKTIMICALSPASSNYEETLSTLRYADRAKKIKNTAAVNENPQDKLMRELREENERLKTMMGVDGGGGGGGGAPASAEQLAEVEAKKKEIEEVQRALEEMQKSFEQRVAESKNQQSEMQERKRRTTIGLVKSQVQCPQLVNLNEDPQLTGRIKYALEEGQVTRIGGRKEDSSSSNSEDDSDEDEKDSDEEEEPDILLLNESIFEKHAEITNIEGQCFLWAEPSRAHATYINGISLAALLKQQAAEKKEDENAEKAEDEDAGKKEDENAEKAEGEDAEKKEDENAEKKENGNAEKKEEKLVEKKEKTSAAKNEEKASSEKDEDSDDEDSEKEKEEKDKKDQKSDDGSGDGSESEEDDEEGEDGEKPEEKPKKKIEARGILLNNGDRVVFAKCFFFFAAPNDTTPEIMILTGQVDFNKANKELKANKLRNVGHKLMKATPSDGSAVGGGGGGSKGLFGPGLLGKLKAAEDAAEKKDGDDDDDDEGEEDIFRPASIRRARTGSLNSNLQRKGGDDSDGDEVDSDDSDALAAEVHALREELQATKEELARKDAELQKVKSMMEKIAPGMLTNIGIATPSPAVGNANQSPTAGDDTRTEINGSPLTLTPMTFPSPDSQANLQSWSDSVLATPFSITPSEVMTPGGLPPVKSSGKSAARMRDALKAIEKVESSLLNLTKKKNGANAHPAEVAKRRTVTIQAD